MRKFYNFTVAVCCNFDWILRKLFQFTVNLSTLRILLKLMHLVFAPATIVGVTIIWFFETQRHVKIEQIFMIAAAIMTWHENLIKYFGMVINFFWSLLTIFLLKVNVKTIEQCTLAQVAPMLRRCFESQFTVTFSQIIMSQIYWIFLFSVNIKPKSLSQSNAVPSLLSL